MEEIKVNIPDGYKIDIENSDLSKGIIKLKQEELTYDQLCMELKSQSEMIGFYIPIKANNKVKAIIKLIKTAYYLNKGWEPNWNDNSVKFYFHITESRVVIFNAYYGRSSIVYFKSEELAKQALKILGERTIRLALS